ncbi:MAG: hypothetical protein M5U09_25010, partial [Gammaproteobacteria bacterium]|nr:hypothetical protein [Gammaproteobacteria bacterium]
QSCDLSGMNYQPPGEELWLQYLRTGAAESIGVMSEGPAEPRPENYVVAGLVDFDDISYDDTAELLYDLAGQVVAKLRGYLAEGDIAKVLRYHQRSIAGFVHAQMQAHYWEEVAGYEVEVRRGLHGAEAECLHPASKTDPVRRLSSVASGQVEHGEVPVRRLPALSLPGPEVPLGHGTEAGGDPGPRIAEVVPAGKGPVPDLLQAGRGAAGIPARLRGRD